MVISAPFNSLTAENQIAVGSASVVYNVNNIVAFKCPIQFDTSRAQRGERLTAFLRRQSEASTTALENEKALFTLLEKSPHPNVVRCAFIAEEGIFLEHLATPLNTYLESQEIVPQPLKARWVLELTSAAAWIEKLGFVHGDLRPENILLTAKLHLKLIDFDCAVARGEELHSFVEPYWQDKSDGSLGKAGPNSEQFALGSCLYFIFYEAEPEVDIIDGQLAFPDISSTGFGSLIIKCWDGRFHSIRKLALSALWTVAKAGYVRDLLKFLYSRSIGFKKSRTTSGKLGPLRRFCEDYLDDQRRNHMPPCVVQTQPIDIRRA
ncbi:hypothetical protein CISG_02108 [Coccidioides immitis RMSCC 3703]|uniref:EKC/KEOPS complex subunit BUD32 n=1 Tax=Coccidioides immitis RMSCC 3703 TaxID=454286 RepID=A0A0J8R5J8_COCIT|nr:hypothetical protein CISG_02108 [Coccidioides immitis RMSCC 3703]